ncbi:MAG: Zn-dependent hydrolase [Pseudomonadota bacterium]
MADVSINAERVLANLYTLREIGKYKTGVHRPTLSPQDMEARHWLVNQLRSIGHEADIDGIANVFGRSSANGRVLLAGSHIESQNYAGWLDGALGIVYALETARVISESSDFSDCGVDVIAFADEEGHFLNFLGSYSYVGELDEAIIDTTPDRTNGTLLRDALASAGLDGKPRLQMEKGRYAGFLEAHIEQGDWLESQDLEIGVVESIVSICQYRLVFEGVQNHAGTTRMAIRKDAGLAARGLCQRIDEAFQRYAAPRTVWTVGQMTLDPGAPSIIPGRAEMIFQFRDANPDKLEELHGILLTLVAEADEAGPCRVSIETLAQSTPAVMNGEIQEALAAAAEYHTPGKHTRMPSGAGHDAQVIAGHIASGMLFVPSIGGISHHYTEDTSDDHIVKGARVFASAAARLMSDA